MKSGDEKIIASRWWAGLYFLAIAAFLVVFYPTLSGLIHQWYNSEEQSYGFFIVPFSIYFVLKKRQKWNNIPVRSNVLGAAAFTLSIMLYIFSRVAEIETLGTFSLVLSIWGGTWFLFGTALVRTLVFPLGLLLLMIPIPAQIYSLATVPLQLFVSKVSAGVAQMVGVPVYREGNVLIMPNHTLAVVQACSGLRSLMALIALCIIFGHIMLKSNWLRTFLVCCAVPVALLANILRVIILLFLFHYFDIDLARGIGHTVLGIIVFIFALASITILIEMLSKWDLTSSAH